MLILKLTLTVMLKTILLPHFCLLFTGMLLIMLRNSCFMPAMVKNVVQPSPNSNENFNYKRLRKVFGLSCKEKPYLASWAKGENLTRLSGTWGKISVIIKVIRIISDDVIKIINFSKEVRSRNRTLKLFIFKSSSSSSPDRSFQIIKRQKSSNSSARSSSESVETESSGNSKFNETGGFSGAVLPK